MKRLLLLTAALVVAAGPACATIPTTATSAVDSGNGVTTVFNYSFLIPYQSDGVTPAVTVQVEDNNGNYTTLSSGQYTITGVGNNAGGTVTYNPPSGALPTGQFLIISRNLNYTQPTAVSNVLFYPHTVETSADNLDAQIQQLATGLQRTEQFPPNDTAGYVFPSAANRKSKTVGFDASGVPTLYSLPSTPGTADAFSTTYTAPYASATLQSVGAKLKQALNVADFGAKCTQTPSQSDDTAAIQAAVTAAAGTVGVVQLPSSSCGYSSTIVFPANVALVGTGNAPYNLVALATNKTAVKFNGSNDSLINVSINCGAAGANSANPCIDIAANQALVWNYLVNGPYIGIQEENNTVLDNIGPGFIYGPAQTNGEGIKIDDPAGNNTDLFNNFCEGIDSTHQPRSCFDIEATQAIYMYNSGSLWGGNGIIYDPQAGEQITWAWDFGGSYDTGTQNGILIQPAGSAPVKGVYMIETWTSSNSLTGIAMVPTGGAVTEIHVINHRAYGNGAEGAIVEDGASDVYFLGGAYCGNSTSSSGTYPGIQFGNVSHIGISNVISKTCIGASNTQEYGIQGTSASANYVSIHDNDLSVNVTGAMSLTIPTLGTNGNWDIHDNLGIDDLIPTVASATSLAAPLNPTFYVSGTTTISTITGTWQGRKMTIIPSGAWAVTTGGNIANACSATSQVPTTVVAAGTAINVHC